MRNRLAHPHIGERLEFEVHHLQRDGIVVRLVHTKAGSFKYLQVFLAVGAHDQIHLAVA